MSQAVKINRGNSLKAGLSSIAALLIILLGAQDDALSLNVSPSRTELSVAPSNVYEGALIVANTDNEDLVVVVRVEDKSNISAPGWFEVRPPEFDLKKDEIKRVLYKVAVPEEAKGELSVMVFIEAKPTEDKGAPIAINTSIGVSIYVVIEGTEKFDAEVEDLQIKDNTPLRLAVQIKNKGNVHIRPRGVIALRTKAGKALFTVPLNEYEYPVLPVTSRTLEIRSDKKLEPGEYIADIKMGYGDKNYKKRMTLTIN